MIVNENSECSNFNTLQMIGDATEKEVFILYYILFKFIVNLVSK